MIELPVTVWQPLEVLAEVSGLPLVVLIEDALKRYTAKPPSKLPPPRKRGRKPKPPAPAD